MVVRVLHVEDPENTHEYGDCILHGNNTNWLFFHHQQLVLF